MAFKVLQRANIHLRLLLIWKFNIGKKGLCLAFSFGENMMREIYGNEE